MMTLHALAEHEVRSVFGELGVDVHAVREFIGVDGVDYRRYLVSIGRP